MKRVLLVIAILIAMTAPAFAMGAKPATPQPGTLGYCQQKVTSDLIAQGVVYPYSTEAFKKSPDERLALSNAWTKAQQPGMNACNCQYTGIPFTYPDTNVTC